MTSRTSKERTLRTRSLSPGHSPVYPWCRGCQDTNIFSFILEQHHVVPLSEMKETDKRYLIFLCPNCHALVHLLRKYYQGALRGYALDEMNYRVSEGLIQNEERLTAIAIADFSKMAETFKIHFQ